MKRRKFKLSHSVLGTLALLVIEFLLLYFALPAYILEPIILLVAIVGAVATLFVATEAIEEVQGSRHMFVMLTVVMLQFVVFFGFQYWFLQLVQPGSFPTMSRDPVSLLLNSVMIFVFNPISLPETMVARSLMLIQTIASLGLVMFVLQNISQFRKKSLDSHE